MTFAAPSRASPRPLIHTLRHRLSRSPLAFVGPGLITGVADDDPSGIVTYTQAGARFGLGMLWTMPLAWPLMAVVQEMCARIGRVTGKGLAANIASAFPSYVAIGAVLLLFLANTLNIAADIAAMGEVAELVTGFDRHLMTAVFVIATLVLQVFVPYHRYVHILKWLTFSLVAYILVVFTVRVPWGQVALRTILPDIKFDATTAQMTVAIFGTTISPYLFFWQASEEVEDMDGRKDARLVSRDDAAAPVELRRIARDTWFGMFVSNAVAYAVILAAGVTLHVAGIFTIDTAAQAASALKPVAGRAAFLLFAVGILGVGLIGVPVLAGSAGYAVGEALGWRTGLEHDVRDARGFYGIIAVSVLAALVIQYSPINPMQALYWSAVINGIVAVPLTIIVVVLASRSSTMGPFTSSRWAQAIGWITAGVMATAVVCMALPG
jgi:NRAMP (natural resistance-associated macrophage protein)-like metal ion transporter